MLISFNPSSGLIIANAKITGPAGQAALRLAVDTGATSTVINREILLALGYSLDSAEDEVRIITGSDVQSAHLVQLHQIEALDVVRQEINVLSHTLPPTAGVDGLLGLNFFRSAVLTIDFRANQISLTQPE